MTKAELIAIMAEDAGITKVAAAKALDAYVFSVGKELKKTGKLGIVGIRDILSCEEESENGKKSPDRRQDQDSRKESHQVQSRQGSGR